MSCTQPECQLQRFARICLEDSLAYARKRVTFGKSLIQHQVIRHKIGEMTRRLMGSYYLNEAVHAQVLRIF